MFSVLIRRWLQHTEQRTDLSPSTRVCYRRVAAHLLAWADSHDATVFDLSDYVKRRRVDGLAPRTLALELRVAKAAIHWAERERLVPPSMVFRVPRMKIDRQRFELNHRTPSPAEAHRAISAMPADDWQLAMLLIARTGARIGEVVVLRGSDLDEAANLMELGTVEGAMKTGCRLFPLDASSLRDLRGRSTRGDGPLFDFGGSRAPIQGLQRRLWRACEDAGVSRFTAHGLRRMVVVRLLKAKVDPGTAAALTGHSIQVMLRYYQQVTDEDRRDAAESAGLGVLDEDASPASLGQNDDAVMVARSGDEERATNEARTR